VVRPPVVISCAVTGSIHTPSMSPYLPLTPKQIADEAISAAQAGAAVLHLHARDPIDGSPSFDPAVFREFVPRIHESTDAVINITTGGSHTMTLEQRLAAAMDVSPEMASCNMGSMNFGYFQVLDKLEEFRFGWEHDYLAGSRDRIFRNTFGDIEHILTTLGTQHGTRFEFECYDVGHLYTLKHFVDRGLVKGVLFLQFALGILGGIGADPENLTHMKRVADKLFGQGYQFSVLAAGRHQIPMATQALLLGGHVRVGLEDSLFVGRGQLARSNAEQVRQIRAIAETLGLQIARPDQARALLGLKGRDTLRLS
jgi:uncharacterized protein (DUF849 family)